MKSATVRSVFLAFLSSVHSEIVLNQRAVETVRLGGSLKLTCQTSGFNLEDTWMSWLRQVRGQGLEWLLEYKHSSSSTLAPGIRNRFTPSKETSSGVFALDMKDLNAEDSAIYYCARYDNPAGQYYLKDWGVGTMVTVTDADPSAPKLYPIRACVDPSSMDSFTFGCLAMDYNPMGITLSWKKDNEPVTTGVKTYQALKNKRGTYTRSSQLTIAKAEAEKRTIYCVVQHGSKANNVTMPDRMVHHTVIAITVTEHDELKRSKKATAVCSLTDIDPQTFSVTWLKNGKPLDSGIVTSSAFELNGTFSGISQLTFPTLEWFGYAIYTCQVDQGKDRLSQNISMSPDASCREAKITIHPPPVQQELMEMTVTLTCVVSDAPVGIKVSWSRGKTHLDSEILFTEVADVVESKVNISTRDWMSGDEFECVVSHENMPIPKRKSIYKMADPHPREPTVSVLLPPTEEISIHKTITLTCFARGFSPRRIFVTWTVDNQRVHSSNYRNTEVVAENGDNSFFMYSLLSVRAEQWASGASFSCVVAHETLPMKTIVRTVNKSSDFTDSIRIEDYEEDKDKTWTTARTFIILFFLSISYAAVLTLVKIK